MPQNPIATTVAKGPSGSQSSALLDSQGAMSTALRHGKYYAASKAGVVGIGANPTAVTTSAGLATTYVGCCLSNPAASGKNLIVQRVAAQQIVAPSTVTGYGLIVGFAAGGITVHTTPLTVLSALVGASAAALVGLVDSACTLVGTPDWARWLAETLVATDLASFSVDVDGEIILPPGAYCAIGSTIAGPASGFQGSISWEEEPV